MNLTGNVRERRGLLVTFFFCLKSIAVGPKGNADPDDTVFGRSEEVGRHYGTISGGVSKANAEVMEAFKGGYSPENAAVVERAVQRTAWQALLKYAHLLDSF